MELQDFIKEIIKRMEETLGDEYQINAEDILKNNGVAAHAVTVRRQGENIAPCIYVENFYDGYLAGKIEIADAVEEMLGLYQKNSGECTFNMDWFRDYNRARPKLQGRLINTGKNQRLLEAIPHREFLDLSLTYMLEVAGPGKHIGHIQVSKEHLEYWGVDEQSLYEATIRDMAKPGKAILESIGTVLEQMLKPDIGQDARKCPAYILSNSNYRDGAVQMLNKRMLKSAARILDGDFIILPSSIHELIFMPVDEAEDEDIQVRQLADMVREVNDTQVEDTEILSYHVYKYRRETGEITIAV